MVVAVVLVGAAACEAGPVLETRTFEVQYLPSYRVSQLIAPYVFTDRAENPGLMSTAEGAVTVRETPDNLEKIGRVLAEYDRPNPTIMLHFQIIEADGAADPDPAIAEVERELRRLFRFEGYELLEQARVTAIQGTGTRQWLGDAGSFAGFGIHTGVSEVRQGSEATTVTLDVALNVTGPGNILETSVTIPAGHSVVLGTARAPGYEGALILVVRAEIVESGMTPSP
ncbi:MAG: hypothetical protein R3314_13545 [Longimicrobiales bacterium]|nr:hypothetical protein [Longimicrobiales bacterium]